MMVVVFVVSMLVGFIAGTATAAEVPVAEVATSSGGLPITEGILGIAVTIMGFFLRWLASRADAKAEREKDNDKAAAKQRALANLFRDISAGVDHVYITKLEGASKDGKLDGKELRAAAYAFIEKAKDSETAQLIKEKGKDWVLSKIHEVANRKTGKQK